MQHNRPTVEEVQKRIVPWPNESAFAARKRTRFVKTIGAIRSIRAPIAYIGKRSEALRLYDEGLWPSQIAGRLRIPHAVVSEWAREVREKEGFT